MFSSERELVQEFMALLPSGSSFSVKSLIEEFNYTYGKPDIVIQDSHNHVIAFEAKLLDINKAINQAYRNNSFADFSFVVCPQNKSQSIIRKNREFERRGIGAAIVCNGYVEILIEPKAQTPYLSWVREKAISKLEGANTDYGTLQLCTVST